MIPAVLLFGGCVSDDMRQARLLMNDGRCDDALPLLSAEIAAAPRNAQAHLMRGACLLHEDRLPDAAGAFKRALLLGDGYRRDAGEGIVETVLPRLLPDESEYAVRLISFGVTEGLLADEDISRILDGIATQWPVDYLATTGLASLLDSLAAGLPEFRAEIGRAAMEVGQRGIEVELYHAVPGMLDVAADLDREMIETAARAYWSMAERVLESRRPAAQAIRYLHRAVAMRPELKGDAASLCLEAAYDRAATGGPARSLVLAKCARDLNSEYVDEYRRFFAEVDPLLFEDFSDGNDAGWGNESRTWRVVDGAYHHPNRTHDFSSIGDAGWADYVVEFDFLGALDGGILVRVQNVTDALALIVRPIEGDIYWIFRKHGHWEAERHGRVALRYPPGSDLHMRVVVRGNEFEAFVNGRFATSLVSDRHERGRIALYTTGGDQAFDNVVVWRGW